MKRNFPTSSAWLVWLPILVLILGMIIYKGCAN